MTTCYDGIVAIIFENSAMYHCPNCLFEGEAKTETPGSFLVELLLWICFLIPGLIYSVWRLSARKKVCSRCRFDNIYKK